MGVTFGFYRTSGKEETGSWRAVAEQKLHVHKPSADITEELNM